MYVIDYFVINVSISELKSKIVLNIKKINRHLFNRCVKYLNIFLLLLLYM